MLAPLTQQYLLVLTLQICKDAADKISDKADAQVFKDVCGIELSRESPRLKLKDKAINEQVPMTCKRYLNHMVLKLWQEIQIHFFFNGDVDENIIKFITYYKVKLNVDVEHYRTFKKIAIKKKHYFGVTDGGEIIIRGMEGTKNDRPAWINNTFNQFVKNLQMISTF